MGHDTHVDDAAVTARPIRSTERSGVLHPKNLERYEARWFDPDRTVTPVVDQYWHVRWHLDAGETIHQRIIDLPAVTLTIEAGAVPAPLVVTGVHRQAWMRQITGSGSVFAIRLRPAGLTVLGDLSPQQIADMSVPLTPELDPRLYRLLSIIAAAPTPEARVRAANKEITAYLAERPIGSELVLANAIHDELTQRIRFRTGPDLAGHFGVSQRTIQRALKTTLGHGPKWISRRIRLQEIARLLSVQGPVDLSILAADLGYTDEAHLINDFRGVAGTTPGAYRRALQAFTDR